MKKPENHINDKKNNKLLYHTPFLDMFQSARGFFYSQRKNVNSIAALCFRYKPDLTVEFFVHYQPMPQIVEKHYIDDMYPCPITGGFDGNESPLECAMREVYEEGGLHVNESHFIASTKAIASTQMNEQVFHFLFEVTNVPQEIPKTDGSFFEQIADNVWLNEEQLRKILLDEKAVKLSSLYICYLLWLEHQNKN
ncbi:NUDIX hydrolase [[Mycoplasma] testudinis]|uniref:NUDIX hydrolase n=1 Tax=[Mycoplasma] testudinis TaxID=33924 RepID=UPI00055CA749|nr:NUDIX hydrolase [[Mycoplasma] testudinis]